MIAEPYICIKGEFFGSLESFERETDKPFPKIWDARGTWIPYADFEREKLAALGAQMLSYDGSSNQKCMVLTSCGYTHVYSIWIERNIKHPLWMKPKGKTHVYYSDELIGYRITDYAKDSESSRLLKRAEFLKAVCGREGVEWLPCQHEGYVDSNGKCRKCNGPQSIITQAGYKAALEKAEQESCARKRREMEDEIRCMGVAVEKSEECPYSCSRAAKLETRLAEHYYAKHEIDERISALINHSDMSEYTKRALRTRFLW